MYESLQARNIDRLYHFTDARNCPSIRERGLLSWREIQLQQIDSICGGNDWSHDADRRLNLDSYVHLCFIQDHPMEHVARQEHRIINTYWIEISIDVLRVADIRYAPGVANRVGIPILGNAEAREQIDLVGIYDYLDFRIEGNRERKNEAKKSEILVPNSIPMQYILNLGV